MPQHPVVAEEPIDLWRNDGYTDYSHDVDEDARGIAWVSGRGGIRGYATRGWHRDPYQNRYRRATPFDPVLVAGGGVGGTAQPTMFMHNSGRPTDGSVRAEGVARGNVLVGTEEDFTRAVREQRPDRAVRSHGLAGAASRRSSRSWRRRIACRPLDTFHPFLDTDERANPDLECSAHYFEIEGSTLGAAWYGQGLRLLDISDARDVRQVGYYRVTGTTPTRTATTHRRTRGTSRSSRSAGASTRICSTCGRGVEVLRVRGNTARSARMKAVTAPSVKADRFARRADRRPGPHVVGERRHALRVSAVHLIG